jgi:hypothetical protein
MLNVAELLIARKERKFAKNRTQIRSSDVLRCILGLPSYGVTDKSMAFLRFVLSQRRPDSGVEDGLFGTAYKLCDDDAVIAEDRNGLRDNLNWFNEHLPIPKRFNRTTSKGYYRRKTRGIAWFRDNATECLTRMHQIKYILEANGYRIMLIREERIGYIVYEDEFQVVAEPFADSRTGSK